MWKCSYMTEEKVGKPRRTQEERTSQTRLAVIEAAIAAIGECGYAGTSTTLIAAKAGVSRGAMLHHFATRAALMAEVVRHVFEHEMAAYEETRVRTGIGDRLYDWPKLLWTVLTRPSGMAVLEILQATRSDQELAALVVPMQEAVEQSALGIMQGAFGGDKKLALSVMRLMVWSIRGLSIAEHYLPHRSETHDAVELLSGLLRQAAPNGMIQPLQAITKGKERV